MISYFPKDLFHYTPQFSEGLWRPIQRTLQGIRRTQTNCRERIALGNTKSRNYEGYATIVDCKEYNVKDLKNFGDKHRVNEFIDGYAGERETLFAWVLSDISVEPKPKSYTYSTGSWCKT